MNNQRGSAALALVGTVAAIIVGGLLLITSYKGIDTGKVGVPKLFGKVECYTLAPGAHFLNPFADVPTLDTRTLTYTMSSVSSEGQKQGDDSVEVLTSDGMTVKLDISVQYNIAAGKAPWIVQNIGGDINEDVVRPHIRAALRDNGANYTATDLFSTKKTAFVNAAQIQLAKELAPYGVTAQNVLLRAVKLPDSVKESIDKKMRAQQDSDAMVYQIAKSKQEADQKRIIAQGDADFNRISTAELTPAILEARRIEAFKELAHSGNMIIVPAGNQMLMQLPSKK